MESSVVRGLAGQGAPRGGAVTVPAVLDAGAAGPAGRAQFRADGSGGRPARRGGLLLLGDADRRRHRLGEDRGLFRGDGSGAVAGQAGSAAPAGDRADPELPRKGGAVVRGATRRMAFGGGQRERERGGSASLRGRPRWWWGRARRCSCHGANLGLIVVDEEHEPAFKQEDGVRYHARDMAVARAQGRFPVVLASATPSLESLVNAGRQRYRHLVLRHRHGARKEVPSVELIDLRAAGPGTGLGCRRPWSAPCRRRWRRASKCCCSSTVAAMHH